MGAGESTGFGVDGLFDDDVVLSSTGSAQESEDPLEEHNPPSYA